MADGGSRPDDGKKSVAGLWRKFCNGGPEATRTDDGGSKRGSTLATTAVACLCTSPRLDWGYSNTHGGWFESFFC